MAKTSPLEAQLTAATQEFVGRIVGILRASSFDEVVQLASASDSPFAAAGATKPGRGGGAAGGAGGAGRGRAPQASSAASSGAAGSASGASSGATSRGGRAARQTADVRQLIANRIVTALQTADGPQSARALASQLGMPLDLLTVPLKELRESGRVHKHGEKRATTYSVA